jgi:large subunit ribosomal protein L35
MNKPIYRYLANKKWRSMKRQILMQRITQMHVVPDVLPTIDPTLDIDLIWHKRVVQPGDFVPSNWSAKAPALRVQKFDAGNALVTIVAVDSDVPNVETDGFDSRCHGVWTDVRLGPDMPDVGKLEGKDIKTVVPWSPPYAQKGSPYHRISLFVFEQPQGKSLSEEHIQEITSQGADSEMWLRGFAEKTGFKPIGVTMFRTQWDEYTADVMKRHNIPGADLEFKRKKPERLPAKYQVKDGLRYRGWKK